MDTYVVIKDWFNDKTGTIISHKNGEYKITIDGNTLTFSEETLKDEEYFEIKQEYPISIKEIDKSVDDTELNFRIQLDIKCTKNKLKEIEKVLRESIDSVL